MMISIEDKLARFKKVISDEISKKNKEEIDLLVKDSEEEIENHKQTVDKKIADLQRDYSKKEEQRKERILSRFHKEGEDLIKEIENEIYKDMQKSLLEELKTAYKTDQGADFLKEQLFRNKDQISSESKIFLSENEFERDKKIVRDLFPENEIRLHNPIKIGGAIIMNKEESFQINCTLDYILEANKRTLHTEIKKILKGEEDLTGSDSYGK